MKSEEFKTMRRCKQELSKEEVREILKLGKRGVRSIQGDGGYPYGIPMNYIYDEQEKRLFFHLAKEGQKSMLLKEVIRLLFVYLKRLTKMKMDGLITLIV